MESNSTIMEASQKVPAYIVIFGGSGDLTWRKLIPALFNLYLDKWMPDEFVIIGIGRQDMSQETYLKKLKDGVDKFSRKGKPKKSDWDAFTKHVEYKQADFTTASIYTSVKKSISAFEKKVKQVSTKIYYLAVPQQFFE